MRKVADDSADDLLVVRAAELGARNERLTRVDW